MTACFLLSVGYISTGYADVAHLEQEVAKIEMHLEKDAKEVSRKIADEPKEIRKKISELYKRLENEKKAKEDTKNPAKLLAIAKLEEKLKKIESKFRLGRLAAEERTINREIAVR